MYLKMEYNKVVTEEEGRAAATLGFRLLGFSFFLGAVLSIVITEKFFPNLGMGGGLLLLVCSYLACREFVYWVHRDKVIKMRATMREYLEERGLANPKDSEDED
jgi:hypothetical protein